MKKLINKIRNKFIACKVKRLVNKLLFPDFTNDSPFEHKEIVKLYNFSMAPGGIQVGHILNCDNWGSAPNYNDSVCSKRNVAFTSNGLLIFSRYEENTITGFDWNGYSVTRNWSNGCWFGDSVKIQDGLCFSAMVSMNQVNLGYWPCPLWVFKGEPFTTRGPLKVNPLVLKNELFENIFTDYFEIDGFEQFIKDKRTKWKSSVTTHFGSADGRKMLTSELDHQFGLFEHFKVEIIFFKESINVYWNGILVYKTTIGVPKEGTRVFPIISDSVSSFNGEVNIDKPPIDKTISSFVVSDLRITIVKKRENG